MAKPIDSILDGLMILAQNNVTDISLKENEIAVSGDTDGMDEQELKCLEILGWETLEKGFKFEIRRST